MSGAGRVQGKVALITGAARGQGRSHAVRLAQEGADIIAIDLCADLPTVGYPLSRKEDLDETARLVEAADRRVITAAADIRDQAALDAIVAQAVAEFGHIDIVSANAGIATYGKVWELTEEQWDETMDVNIGGAWKTAKAVIPTMLDAGQGGSIIFTASFASNRGVQNIGHYVASKHAIIGLMRTLAVELAPQMIRVNTVNPSSVATGMFMNDQTYGFFRPDLEHPTREDMADVAAGLNLMPVPWMDPIDISHMVVYLGSDESRYVTGSQFQVDAGAVLK